MAEVITQGFLRLFEIRLLHHYWLDDGATMFDLLPKQDERDRRLLTYDARGFLTVRPTDSTAQKLADLHCVFKETALGCVVAAPKETVISLDATFEFAVTVTNATFYNYTALTLPSRNNYEFYHQQEKKTYRFRENVPLLSNLTGAARTNGAGKALFLSREFPGSATDDRAESLVVRSQALLQLTSDEPGAASMEIHADAAAVPVFLHQGDIPAIVPPPGLSGVPGRGVELSEDLPADVFAVLRIAAIRQDDGDFSVVDNAGRAKPSHPVFQVRFKNRSTIWRYIRGRTGIVDSEEPDPLPLTHYGNAGTRQKPSVGLVKPVKTGDRVTEIVSEIFI
ncbi:MAG: hypothetical protein EG824_06545 [Deltaproteobacteria bacterium]|nr:hypothetical protein [Deltaproteobacteria bacterium]